MCEQQVEKEKYFSFEAKTNHLNTLLDVGNGLKSLYWSIHCTLSTLPSNLQ